MVICMMPTLAFAEEGSDPAQAGENVPVENSQEETPAAEPDNVTTLSGENATAENLAKALTGAESGTVIMLDIGKENTLMYSASLSVPAGVKLEVKSGKLSFTHSYGVTLKEKDSSIQIDKDAEVEAKSITLGPNIGSAAVSLTVYGKLTTSNSLTVKKECTATVSGTVTCNGGITNSGTFSIENSGMVNCQNSFMTNNGMLTVGEGCNLNVTTSLTNGSTANGSIVNSGTISAKVYSGGSSKGYGNVENYGTFSTAQNFGSNKAFSQTKGIFRNEGTLNVGSGESENAATMTIGNTGVVDCTLGAKLYVKTKLENKGSVTLPENYTPPTDSTNSGTVIVLGENAEYPFDGEEALMASISNAGRTGFSVNLASALTGAVAGDTVTMLQDCKITGNPNVTSPDVTLDLKGNTLTMSSKLNVNSGAKLTVTDSSDGKTGTVNGAFADISGELVIKDGTFGYTDSAAAAYNFSVKTGKLQIDGGTFTAEKGLATYEGSSSGEIAITDPNFTFVNTDTGDFDNLPIACAADGSVACKISLPEGKQISRIVNKDGNGTYTFALTAEQAVASVDGVSYVSLQEAFNAAASGSVVTLLRDTIATDVTYVPAGKEIVLDMNGYEYVGLNLVTISPLANSTLTVKDTSGKNAALSGKFTISIGRVTGGAAADGAAVILESGANIVSKRTLTNDTVGVAVESRHNSSATTVTVKDGAQVSGIRAGVELLAEDSVINMEGGNVSCNANWGAVTVGTDGTINISGGSIEGNKYTIVAGTNAVVNITDGTVCGLIYLDGNNSNLEIEGGTFSGKKSDSVQITGENTAEVTISGGVFEQALYSSTASSKPQFKIEAGLFKTEPADSDIVDGKDTSDVKLDGEDYTSVGNATAGVAQVGENAFYTDIDTAITAANAAGEDEEATLTILDDVALDENTPEVDSDVKVKVANGAVIDNNSSKELTVTNSNGKEVTVPAGAVLDGNGNVVAGTKDQRPQVNPDGTVTVPAGGTITRPDGKVTEVPAESQVNTAVAYTINFQDGKASETKVLYSGMALPTPAKSGYTFGGWFTDKACTNAFDIAKTEAGEYTLYAKWTANSTGYYPATPTVQKPVIETTEGAAAVLDSTGTTATITVADGYELVDVTVNGISKGKVTTLTGLKTGDKVVVTAQKITDADDIAAQIAAVKSVKLIARSQMSKAQGKKAVKITWYATDGSEVELDGVEIFRSTKRYSGYGKKPIFTTTKAQYHNTAVRTGTKYYYKVRGYKVIAGEKVYTDWSTKAWRTVK